MTALSANNVADSVNAFVPGQRFVLAGAGRGPLSDLTFAVKDLIDVAGSVTGGGNPDWARAHPPAERHADAVSRMLAAGATFVGKTITDELAFSLEGRNAFYGAPLNPAHPARLTGGSSAGSAAAVAAQLADVALGTDTGGSVRVPGAFCGIFAFRPSHGAIDMAGVLHFAPSYDTLGWFARDARTLARVGDVLLPPQPEVPLTDLRLGNDACDLADDDVAALVRRVARQLATGPAITLTQGDFARSQKVYSRLQAADIRTALGPDIARIRPTFGANMAGRFAEALVPDDDLADDLDWRRQARDLLADRLPAGRAAIIPTSPVAGLVRDVRDVELGNFYARALALGAIAGHAGAPQVQIPVSGGAISAISAPGSDRALLRLAIKLTEDLL